MIAKGESAPRLWIVAGPDGCGKSTAYSRSDVSEFDGSVWIINPDLLTRRLAAVEGLKAQQVNPAAVQRIEAWLDASVDVHQTIGVETVLSTDKYRRLVIKAKERGFEIRLIYVYVDTLERQLERIRLRVVMGGHDVPPDKVATRRVRSFAQMPRFFWQSDHALVYDNSGASPELAAWKDGGAARLGDELLPELQVGIRDAAS